MGRRHPVWQIHIWDMTHPRMRRDSSIYMTLSCILDAADLLRAHISRRDMTHAYMWRTVVLPMQQTCYAHAFLYEAWLVYISDMKLYSRRSRRAKRTGVYMRHDSCLMSHVHTCAFYTSAASRIQLNVINIDESLSYLDESRLIHRWVMSHVHTCAFYTSAASRIQLNVTYVDESCLM